MSQAIKKTMLIIKSDANALKGVEQFLKNRDWHLTSTHQMKNAVMCLVQTKPSFVLISVDHSNKKMMKLPKVIASAFPCCVMVFAEKSTTASFKLLMDSGVEYKINPPLTGPAIERAVNKYIRDQEQASRQKEQGQSGAEGDKSQFEFSVEIKSGGADKQSGFVNVTATSKAGENPAGFTSGEGGHSAQDSSFAQSLLAQLGGDDEMGGLLGALASQNGGQSVGGGQNSQPGQAGMVGGMQNGQSSQAGTLGGMQNGQPGSLGGTQGGMAGQNGQNSGVGSGPPGSVGYMPSQQHGKNSSNSSNSSSGGNIINFQAPGRKDQAGGEAGTLNARSSKGQKGTLEPNGSGEDIMIGQRRGGNKSNSAVDPVTGEPNELYVPPTSPDEAPALLNPEQKKKTDDPIFAREVEEDSPRKASKNEDEIRIKDGGFFNEESVFIRGVNQTLDDSVVKVDGMIQQHLEDNTHLACIVVESTKFSGYLVAAIGKDKKFDEGFVEMVRTRLTKFLRDNGEPIESEENLQLKIQKVDFENWALEYAQFLRKSVHKGDEVAMAFFPFADAQTKVGASAVSTMVSVKTSEIQTDTPLEFNMYMYLPTNKKYILYTPKGGQFLEKQKQRLMKQGMSRMHIKKDDVQNLGKFKAQNHLNSLVEQHNQKKTQKKKAA